MPSPGPQKTGWVNSHAPSSITRSWHDILWRDKKLIYRCGLGWRPWWPDPHIVEDMCKNISPLFHLHANLSIFWNQPVVSLTAFLHNKWYSSVIDIYLTHLYILNTRQYFYIQGCKYSTAAIKFTFLLKYHMKQRDVFVRFVISTSWEKKCLVLYHSS